MALFQKSRQAAQLLAETLIKAFPSTLEPMSSRKALDIRGKALQQLLEQTITIQRRDKLGILDRIIFARDFQKQLREAGYSPAFIRQTTAEVLAKISFAT